MRKSFATLPAPVIAGVIRRHTKAEAKADIRNYEIKGAGMIDLHISCLDEEYRNEETLRELIEFTRLPLLGLNYNLHNNQFYETSEEERVSYLKMAVKAGAAGIDMQGYTLGTRANSETPGAEKYSFMRSNPNEVCIDDVSIGKQTELIEEVHREGAEVLLSTHTFTPLTAEQMVDLALFLCERKPDAMKFVNRADTEEEMIESFRTMALLKKEVPIPVHLHCIGEKGRLTRIINPLLGGFIVFTNDGYHAESDLAQIDITRTKTILDNMKLL